MSSSPTRCQSAPSTLPLRSLPTNSHICPLSLSFLVEREARRKDSSGRVRGLRRQRSVALEETRLALLLLTPLPLFLSALSGDLTDCDRSRCPPSPSLARTSSISLHTFSVYFRTRPFHPLSLARSSHRFIARAQLATLLCCLRCSLRSASPRW